MKMLNTLNKNIKQFVSETPIKLVDSLDLGVEYLVEYLSEVENYFLTRTKITVRNKFLHLIESNFDGTARRIFGLQFKFYVVVLNVALWAFILTPYGKALYYANWYDFKQPLVSASFMGEEYSVIEEPVKEPTQEEITSYILEVFDNDKVALALFKSENGYAMNGNKWDCSIRHDNSNNTSDIGIAQINTIHWDRFGGEEKLKDCFYNIEVAHQLKTEWDGYHAWSAFNNGSYRNYL